MLRSICLVVLLVNTILIQTTESVRDNTIRRRQRYDNSNNIRRNHLRSSVVTPRGLPNWFFLRKEAKVPCETIPDRPPVPDDTANRNLWEILERTKTTFKLDDAHKDVILLLGNTGSGKTTVTQMVAGDANSLKVYKTKDGNKVILDPNNKIGLTTVSQTLIPELVVSSSGLAFYKRR